MSLHYTIIERKITGHIHVKENSQYNDVEADSIHIDENITVRLFGSVRKRLTIGRGARVYLHGTIGGPVENLGGEFYRY